MNGHGIEKKKKLTIREKAKIIQEVENNLCYEMRL
jgi:hypothetical protein